MEILSTTKTTSEIVFMLFLIAAVLVWIAITIAEHSETRKGNTTALGIVIFAVLLVVFGIKNNQIEEYKVIVHDWNEVYENGYEVVSVENKIVTLRKTNE